MNVFFFFFFLGLVFRHGRYFLFWISCVWGSNVVWTFFFGNQVSLLYECFRIVVSVLTLTFRVERCTNVFWLAGFVVLMWWCGSCVSCRSCIYVYFLSIIIIILRYFLSLFVLVFWHGNCVWVLISCECSFEWQVLLL